ncbi:MAG: hypothetical protein C0603_01460 [Denitrovibrio sp.]|nr:MAG: hypothetical protein C0603_01460 [Denitrovibrio sp.]
MDTKWLQESFDKGKLEVLKFAKTSKIKIDITSLSKKKDERIKLLGNKVMELVENGELDSELFEPDFTYIKNIETEIKDKEEQLADAVSEEAENTESTEQTEGLDIVQIESQKVITADSIPLEPQEEVAEEPEADKDKKDYTI